MPEIATSLPVLIQQLRSRLMARGEIPRFLVISRATLLHLFTTLSLSSARPWQQFDAGTVIYMGLTVVCVPGPDECLQVVGDVATELSRQPERA